MIRWILECVSGGTSLPSEVVGHACLHRQSQHALTIALFTRPDELPGEWTLPNLSPVYSTTRVKDRTRPVSDAQ